MRLFLSILSILIISTKNDDDIETVASFGRTMVMEYMMTVLSITNKSGLAGKQSLS